MANDAQFDFAAALGAAMPDPPGELQPMLDLLQGNILKGHGRRVSSLLLLRIGAPDAAKTALAALADQLTPASRQLAAAQAKRRGDAGQSRAPLLTCALSRTGYGKLGFADGAMPADSAFLAGMRARGALLSDPPVGDWQEQLRGPIDGVVQIAGDAGDVPGRSPEVDAAEASVRGVLEGAIQIVGVERGRAWPAPDGQNVMEHFGFVDGISQPLFLDEDIKREPATHWFAGRPLAGVLVRDTAVADDPYAYGSYLVFRKLEQNVEAFGRAILALQAELKSVAGDLPDAGFVAATLIGRYPDGTPLAVQATAGAGPTNDFAYGADPYGLACPFHAHVRKTNSRGSLGLEIERTTYIARRGITYGEREYANQRFSDSPSHGVGLLFMAYQADISAQFERIQKQWADDAQFPRLDAGKDPLLGTGAGIDLEQEPSWGRRGSGRAQVRLERFVTMLGGEYFFAPSIKFFRQLKR